MAIALLFLDVVFVRGASRSRIPGLSPASTWRPWPCPWHRGPWKARRRASRRSGCPGLAAPARPGKPTAATRRLRNGSDLRGGPSGAIGARGHCRRKRFACCGATETLALMLGGAGARRRPEEIARLGASGGACTEMAGRRPGRAVAGDGGASETAAGITGECCAEQLEARVRPGLTGLRRRGLCLQVGGAGAACASGTAATAAACTAAPAVGSESP